MPVVATAGERLALTCADGRFARLLAEGAAGEFVPAGGDPSTVALTVEKTRQPFSAVGMQQLARGVQTDGRRVLLANSCSSGWDLLAEIVGDQELAVTARYRPTTAGRAAAFGLRSRFHLLTREVLLQYPVLWWAGLRGRAPVHASVCTTGRHAVLVAGPSGIGKSTLLQADLAQGALATTDNVCVSDGRDAWGLVEPLRVEGGTGRRMPHGRREAPLARRVPVLTPDFGVVPGRSADGRISVREIEPEQATRTLVAGTYMAGELRRYWGFAGSLALATRLGPPHPLVHEVATALAQRLSWFRVEVPRVVGVSLSGVLAEAFAQEVAR